MNNDVKFVCDDVRVFYNTSNSDKPWSIDFGTHEYELCCGMVCFKDVSGVVETDLSADNVNRPKAWIRFTFVEVLIRTDGIVAISKRGR